MNYFSAIVSLLRDRDDFMTEIRESVGLKSKISALLLSSFCCFALYGAIIGSFHSPLQALSSAIKLPALYLITLIVCLPTLYIFNVLFGSKQSITQHFTYLLTAVSVIAVLLCGFAPVTLFFLITINSKIITNYYFFMLLNVAIFGLTGVLGVSFLYQVMKPNEAEYKSQKALEAEEDFDDEVEEVIDRPRKESVRPVSNMPKRYVNDFQEEKPPLAKKIVRDEVQQSIKVRTEILRFWLVLYGFVGSQLGWVLRPFFGSPGNFELFRPREGNFITGVWNALSNLF